VKIVKQGIPPKPWYADLQGTCATCGTVVRFEESDEALFSRGVAPGQGQAPFGVWTCPICRQPNRLVSVQPAGERL
jgi:hypothetical protein